MVDSLQFSVDSLQGNALMKLDSVIKSQDNKLCLVISKLQGD